MEIIEGGSRVVLHGNIEQNAKINMQTPHRCERFEAIKFPREFAGNRPYFQRAGGSRAALLLAGLVLTSPCLTKANYDECPGHQNWEGLKSLVAGDSGVKFDTIFERKTIDGLGKVLFGCSLMFFSMCLYCRIWAECHKKNKKTDQAIGRNGA